MPTALEEIDEVIFFPLGATALFPLPLFSQRVECGGSTTGFASPADDYIEAHLDLHQFHGIKRHACFLVKAFGESMIDAGILEGDILIVDTSASYRENSIVVCELNGAYKVKMIQRAGDKLYLVSRNPSFAPIEIQEYDDLLVFGVVKGLSRNFLS